MAALGLVVNVLQCARAPPARLVDSFRATFPGAHVADLAAVQRLAGVTGADAEIQRDVYSRLVPAAAQRPPALAP